SAATSTSTRACRRWGRSLSVERNVGAQAGSAGSAGAPRTAPPPTAPALELAEITAGDSAVPRIELLEWANRYGQVAGITPRPLSLGLWSDEPVGQVIGRWRAFRAAFGARFTSVVLAHQLHGSDVHWNGAFPEGWHVLGGSVGNENSVL